MRPGSLLRSFCLIVYALAHARATAWRHLAQLQRANVGDDLPAIFDRYLRRVARHCTPAVCHDVEEMAHGRLSQFVLMKRRGRGFVEAAPRDHAVAITRQPV